MATRAIEDGVIDPHELHTLHAVDLVAPRTTAVTTSAEISVSAIDRATVSQNRRLSQDARVTLRMTLNRAKSGDSEREFLSKSGDC